jgi:adenosyl cobinamide kinase/adenosyl cobinamide phosphate guanylyltransferase
MLSFTFITADNTTDGKAVVLQKGDKAPFDGILLDSVKAKKVETLLKENEEILILKKIIESQNNLIIEKDKEVSLWKEKYVLSDNLNTKLEKDIKFYKIVNNILIITNCIGWSIVVGETSGIAVGFYLKYHL